MNAEKMLGELLAIIHCDGGHFEEAHGTQAAFDAAVLELAYLHNDSMEIMEIRKASADAGSEP
jgi:hypothetical protein